MRILFFFVVLILVFSPLAVAAAEDLTIKQIIDGDTFEAQDGRRMRIWGVNAPEHGEFGYWSAAAVFEKIVAENPRFSCEKRHTDKYHRTVVQCSQGKSDLGSLLVRSGWVRDYAYFSKGFYAADEEKARAKKRGLWTK